MHDSFIGTRRPSTVERWAPSVYFVIGQLGWFACVLSAARDVPWMGVATTIVLVAVHLARVDRPLQEFKLLVSALVVGAIWESVPVSTGLLVYPNGTVLPGAAPYWVSDQAAGHVHERWMRRVGSGRVQGRPSDARSRLGKAPAYSSWNSPC